LSTEELVEKTLQILILSKKDEINKRSYVKEEFIVEKKHKKETNKI
jgi:hypothetical protein